MFLPYLIKYRNQRTNFNRNKIVVLKSYFNIIFHQGMELLFQFHVSSAVPSVSMGKVRAVWDLHLTFYHFFHSFVYKIVGSQCMFITGRLKSDKKCNV